MNISIPGIMVSTVAVAAETAAVVDSAVEAGAALTAGPDLSRAWAPLRQAWALQLPGHPRPAQASSVCV